MIDRRPRAPVSRAWAFLAIALQRLVGELQVGLFHREQPLVLLGERVLRLGEHADQRRLVERRERADHRQPADQFRNHAELDQVVRSDVRQRLGQALVVAATSHSA